MGMKHELTVRTADALARAALRDKPEVLEHSLRLGDAAVTLRQRSIALLHDVLEDTEVTADALRLFVDGGVVDSVEILTRRFDETYAAYITRIHASEDIDAVIVKRIDLFDHLHTVRIGALSESMIKRYRKALYTLEI